MKVWWGGAAVLAAVLAIPGVAAAAPKSECPGGESGWRKELVGDIASEIWDGLIDTSPWDDDPATFAAEIRARYDRNGDGDACLTTRWGDRPSEQANWYGVPYFLVMDNRAAG